MFPIEGPLVTDATRHLAHSALPDAPVVPDEEKPPKTHRSRQTLARTLRTLADRLEPSRCGDPPLQPRTQ
ncbi:hypothetical protein [Streptomyces sp. WMMB 322]|uniref:hypothetical protein n=1 Tax=Streptomyces sp. WMMB 322 TaxID=1286821 RepID=UPI0006E45A15|nr:hypothetical protein [Streptomyces sp. WMMB 322]SCK58976.1 hypothetical protein H180DRAFT_05632 [Streptomyces sp. WMMB 322]